MCVSACVCGCSVCVSACVCGCSVCVCMRMCVQCVCVLCGYELTNGVDIERACLPQTGSGEGHPLESSESSLNVMLAVLEGNNLDILGVRRKMPDDGDTQQTVNH